MESFDFIKVFLEDYVKLYRECKDYGELHSLNNATQRFLLILERSKSLSPSQTNFVHKALKDACDKAKLRLLDEVTIK